MKVDDVKKIGVIGSGSMGSQIAMVSALAGYPVVLQDISESSLVKAKQSLHYYMNNRVKKGLISVEEVNKAFELLEFTNSLNSMSDVDFVVEAIVEKLNVKREVFAKLDEITPKHAILSTNSSTIVSSKLASATNRPGKVCNVHFFTPVLKMELVEVVRGTHTDEETIEVAFKFVEKINKLPILIKKEISGFLANRILGKFMDEAFFLLENGYATHEEIDLVVTKALNHSIGPFALTDFIGVDIGYDVRMQRYKETGDEADKPSKLIEKMVKNGELGIKSGKGFYSYS